MSSGKYELALVVASIIIGVVHVVAFLATVYGIRLYIECSDTCTPYRSQILNGECYCHGGDGT